MSNPSAEEKIVKPVPLGNLFQDVEARENGGWVTNVDNMDGVDVKTRGWTSDYANKVRDDLIRARPPHLIEGTDEFIAAKATNPVAHKREVDDADTSERRTVLKALILDWRNLGGIPYSENNLNIICFREEANGFRNILITAALQVGSMRHVQDEARLKNFVAGLGISFDSQE